MNSKPFLALSLCLFFGTALGEEATAPAALQPENDDQTTESPKDEAGAKKKDKAPAVVKDEVERALESVPIGEIDCDDSVGFNLIAGRDGNAVRHATLPAAPQLNPIGGICAHATIEITPAEETRAVETSETPR